MVADAPLLDVLSIPIDSKWWILPWRKTVVNPESEVTCPRTHFEVAGSTQVDFCGAPPKAVQFSMRRRDRLYNLLAICYKSQVFSAKQNRSWLLCFKGLEINSDWNGNSWKQNLLPTVTVFLLRCTESLQLCNREDNFRLFCTREYSKLCFTCPSLEKKSFN